MLLTRLPSPSFLCSFSSSFFLPSFYSLLECGRRGAVGRPRRRLGGGPRGEAATTPGTALGGPGGSRPGARPGLSRAPARTPLSPKSHWEVRAGEARRARGDALWQMLDGRRGAEAALLLCPSSPAGFRGDGLVTVLTLGPVVASTPPRTSDFGASGLSRRRPHPATGSGLLPI